MIPARAGVTIEGVDSFEDHLVVYERERGLEKICIRDGAGSFLALHRFSRAGLHRRRDRQRRI